MSLRRATLFLLTLSGLVAVLVAAGCSSAPPSTGESGSEGTAGADWRQVQVSDVLTGETFSISDLAGKPVVLETMAVWCTTCLAQQREMAKAKEQLGDKAVFISIDVDPNESADKLKDHVQSRDFTWSFVVDPGGKVGRQLADQFGVNVLNPPSTPIVLIDKDQQPRLLRFGIKGAQELVEEIEKAS